MAKKLILLAMAVAAFAALAIPATASALTLTDHAGKVQPGAWIVGTSTNTVTTNTPVGELTCPHIEWTARVITNNGSLATTGEGEVGIPVGCGAEGEPLTVTVPTLTHIESTGNDEGNAGLSFETDVGGFECPYGGTVPFTYETGTGHDVLHLTGRIFSPFEFCENEEEIVFHGDYTLTTTNGKEVWAEPGA